MKDITSIWEPRSSDPIILPDSVIRDVIDAGTYWYFANDLVLNLRAAPDEVGMNTFDTEMNPRDILRTNWRIDAALAASREWDYWVQVPFNAGADPKYYNYKQISENRLILGIDSAVLDEVNRQRNLGDYPRDVIEFGIMILTIDFKNPDGDRFSKSYAIKVTFNSPFESPTVVNEDLSPVTDIENEYTSPCFSFENLFVPSLSCSFKYNFYEVDEDNYEIISDRDYTGYKETDIPKYIELTWDIAPKWTQPIVATERVDSEPETIEAITEVATETIVPEEGTSAEEGGINFAVDGVETAASDGFVYVLDPTAPGVDIMTDIGGRTFHDAISTFDSMNPRPTVLDDPTATDRLRTSVDPFIGNVPVPRLEVPWLKSGYVGYVILKERLDEVTEEFLPLDLLVIDGRQRNKIIDWKVAYSEVYRYRIRSIFRYINLYDLSMYRDSDEVLDTSETFEKFEKRRAIGAKETYYYDGKSSKACEASAIEFASPPPPHNLRLFPDSKQRHIFITWNQKNPSRDIEGFNVYRKTVKDRFFTKINSGLLNIRNNFWVDYDIDFEKEYIYSIESVDVHGNFSLLSVQYWTKIVPQNIDLRVRCEEPQVFFAHEGEALDGTRIGQVRQKRSDNLMFFDKKFNLKINPIYKSNDNNDKFLLKVMSLDTGMIKQIKFKLSTETIYHKVERKPPPKPLSDRVAEQGGQAGLTESFIGDLFGDRDFTR